MLWLADNLIAFRFANISYSKIKILSEVCLMEFVLLRGKQVGWGPPSFSCGGKPLLSVRALTWESIMREDSNFKSISNNKTQNLKLIFCNFCLGQWWRQSVSLKPSVLWPYLSLEWQICKLGLLLEKLNLCL